VKDFIDESASLESGDGFKNIKIGFKHTPAYILAQKEKQSLELKARNNY